MTSVDQQAEEFIAKKKSGTILFTEDFDHLGNPGAVNVAVHRAEKKKLIRRLTRGIYAKPKESDLVGEVLPSVEEVAGAIAKRDKARILPTGSYAMHRLGLSTQVPMKVVFLTDGSPRKISIGNRTIQFKQTTPKLLSMKGEISKLVVQALKGMGQGKVTPDEKMRVIEILKKEDRKLLKHDIALVPRWIGEIMGEVL